MGRRAPRARSGRARAILLAAAGALALAATAGPPAAAQTGELGPPGRPTLVPGHRVVVEGILEERGWAGGAPVLALAGTDGRRYRIAGEEAVEHLAAHVGERLTLTGTLRPAARGPDELLVESVRLGER